MEITGHPALSDLIHTMLAAEDLDGIRRPHFEVLSMALIHAIRETPGSIGQSVYLMHCPMVYADRGAGDGHCIQSGYEYFAVKAAQSGHRGHYR